MPFVNRNHSRHFKQKQLQYLNVSQNETGPLYGIDRVCECAIDFDEFCYDCVLLFWNWIAHGIHTLPPIRTDHITILIAAKLNDLYAIFHSSCASSPLKCDLD